MSYPSNLRDAQLSYPSNLKDAQWGKIEGFFYNGNRSLHSKRLLVDAVLYLAKTGCQWRQLPKDFPPWPTVQSFFRRAKAKGIWENILKTLVKQERKRNNRKSNPTYGVVDSQSVKTTGPSIDRGIDG
jgi:putative transposase